MKKLFLVLFSIMIWSCQTQDKSTNKILDPEYLQGQVLFEQRCNLCHDAITSHPDSIIAPPFYAVKRQYTRFSMDKEDFTATMRAYIEEPNVHNALMKPAVDRFGKMPQQFFQEGELDKILNYIYLTDFEKPEWFDKHDDMHRRGQQHSH